MPLNLVGFPAPAVPEQVRMFTEEYGLPIRTLQDLETLVGTYETIRMKFKDSRLMCAGLLRPLCAPRRNRRTDVPASCCG
jgi:hypothetical protein